MGFQNVVVGRINGVVALTGFSYDEMYGRFAGTKKSGRINEVVAVVVLSRWRWPLDHAAASSSYAQQERRNNQLQIIRNEKV